MEKPIIKVGADPFPPYQYVDPSGNPAGTDYQHVTAIMKKAGWEPQVFIEDWDQMYARFAQGDLDAVFQVQDTPERLEKYYFSQRLRDAETLVVTTKPELAGLKSYQDIPDQGLSLGLIQGFANGPQIDRLPEGIKQYSSSTATLLQAVCSGQVDLAVCDKGVMEYLLPQLGLASPLVVEGLTFSRPLYVMFRSEQDRDAYDQAAKLL